MRKTEEKREGETKRELNEKQSKKLGANERRSSARNEIYRHTDSKMQREKEGES